MIRSRLRAVRDAIDERLHPGRRERARERFKASRPTSVLFICLGNVCRSPYAERVLALRAGESLEVDSAGFIGPGRPPPERAVEAALAAGIDHADHRSKTITPDLLDAADAVFIFDRHNARRLRATPGARQDRIYWLGDFDPQWSGRRAIVDPWGKPIEEFEQTFARIGECIDELLRAL